MSRYPEWFLFALITISSISALWAVIQIRFHFQKRKLELSKLKAETKRVEFEAKRAEIEVINAGTNLRRGLYDIERSKMNLLKAQNELADRWGVPAGYIRSEIFLDHPAKDVKERTRKLLDSE